MEKVFDGIVVNAVDHKDSNKLLTILSTNGKISAVCKGVKKDKSKLKIVAYPFCFAEFTILEAKNNTIIGANVYDSFFNLSQNYKSYLCGCAILDLIYKTNIDTESGELLTLCVFSVKKLCYENENPISVLLFFLINYLSILGYKINTQQCSSCGKVFTHNIFLNVYEGSSVCSNCAEMHCTQLDKNEVEFINNCLNGNLRNNMTISKLKELLRAIGNTVFCLTNIKLKIEDVLNAN